MKELIKNYKVWLFISILFLALLISVCIFSASNFYKLESYEKQEIENSNQKTEIVRLTSENLKLQSEIEAYVHSDEISNIIHDFVLNYYNNSDGMKTPNQKIESVKKYISEDIYQEIYDKNSDGEMIPKEDRIRQTANVRSSAYEIFDTNHATGYTVMDMTFIYPDYSKEETTVFLQMEFEFDKDKEIWKIIGLSSGNIKIKSVWGDINER